jgi:hypothetical protein
MNLPKVEEGMFLARHKTALQKGGPFFSTFPEGKQNEEFYCGDDGNWVRVTPEEARLLATPAKAPVANQPASHTGQPSLQARFLSGETLNGRELNELAVDLEINAGQKKADLVAAIKNALQK